ncbi:hypothetical protein AHAS_Ahas19G0314100 [Arachis hypogaea]
MARIKTMACRPSSSQATEPSNAPSRPSASKGKQQATEEEPHDPQNLNLSSFLVLKEVLFVHNSIALFLASVCENVSLLNGLIPTQKSLGLFRAQLHRIVNHIILPVPRVT